VLDVPSPDDVLVDEDDEADVLEALELVAVPGIVFALMAPNRPTPMTALMAAPVVSRLRRCMAASRACTLACVVSLVSMAVSVVAASKPRLRGSWELAKKNVAGRTLVTAFSIHFGACRPRSSGAPRAAHSIDFEACRPRSSGDRAGRS
jgi:hypothetical protein